MKGGNIMERLKSYFSTAKTVSTSGRQVGIEVENLLVDQNDGLPISEETSQAIFGYLANSIGWQVEEIRNGKKVRLKRGGFSLYYELGWNNFELVSPPYGIGDERLFSDSQSYLLEIVAASSNFGTLVTGLSWDGSVLNTLMIPDRRDEIWLELDGEALFGLGHIAAIHYNLDLLSVEEGMSFIVKLLPFFEKMGWPPRENRAIWEDYLKNSKASYQSGRYGPPPSDFDEYCCRLGEYKVVMNLMNGGSLEIARPAVPFVECQNPNIDMFLRSVWWWMRLRVRGGKLVLEIRDVPRTIPLDESFAAIRNCLGI